jgi:flagellar basal-body rod modification protein FlgD
MNIQDMLGASTRTQGTSGKGQKELGQQDFLALLVAQMKNQDPSNPADNGEFLSQIAQFTMVDGIEKLGTSFDSIAGNYFTGQAMSASQLVGREVLADSSSAVLKDGGSLHGLVDIPALTGGLNVQVRDASGRLVKTVDSSGFKEGSWALNWDGTNDKGELQAPGEYVVLATALVDGKHQALSVQLYNSVESITLNRADNNVQLQLGNGASINFSAVSQYR